MADSEENELEKSLRLAAEEPAHRPAFSALLLESSVFVIGTAKDVSEDDVTTLEAGSDVQLQQWETSKGEAVIPFFSSLAVLNKSVTRDESCLELPAISLFELTAGATLFLNPKSDYGKEFLPQEIQNLLSVGSSEHAERRVVEEETQVLLGQPSEYPSQMVSSLVKFFSKESVVQKAYLAMMKDPSPESAPHLVIGVELLSHDEKLMRDIGSVASAAAPSGMPIDLVEVTQEDAGISGYFLKETSPFYSAN